MNQNSRRPRGSTGHRHNRHHYHHLLLPLLQIILNLFVVLQSSSEGLQLIHSWQGFDKGSILSASCFSVVRDDETTTARRGREKDGQEHAHHYQHMVATAGHNGGKVCLWTLPSYPIDRNKNENDSTANPVALSTFDIHGGSIFALSHFKRRIKKDEINDPTSSQEYLISGSFDRKASLHRIRTISAGSSPTPPPPLQLSPEETNNSKDTRTTTTQTLSDTTNDFRKITLESIASLPDHTGWVRGVQGIFHPQRKTSSDSDSDTIYMLSIGCNLINIWTIMEDTTHHEEENVDKEQRVEQESNVKVVRVARLDAGLSPDDPPHEPFRRHDILCLVLVDQAPPKDTNPKRVATESVDYNGNIGVSSPWIVAGLVDGTLRIFDGRFQEWSTRRTESPYDATGGCTRMIVEVEGRLVNQDDVPRLAVMAHQGRITGVHILPQMPGEFVSVGHDGRWVRWRIEVIHDEMGTSNNDVNKLTLHRVSEGCVPSIDGDPSRICSSVIVNDEKGTVGKYTLLAGTTAGSLYEIDVSPHNDGTVNECCEIWRASNGKNTISALASMECHDRYGNTVVAGTSSGSVLVFKEEVGKRDTTEGPYGDYHETRR